MLRRSKHPQHVRRHGRHRVPARAQVGAVSYELSAMHRRMSTHVVFSQVRPANLDRSCGGLYPPHHGRCRSMLYVLPVRPTALSPLRAGIWFLTPVSLQPQLVL